VKGCVFMNSFMDTGEDGNGNMVMVMVTTRCS
jgi:hypothetical protein